MKRKHVDTSTTNNVGNITASKDPTNTNQNDDTSTLPPPPYGTREYWEERYRKNIETLARRKTIEQVTDSKKEDKTNGVESESMPMCNNDDNDPPTEEGEEEEASPGFEWYFKYNELQPLLLPLVVKYKQSLMDWQGPDDDDDSDDDNNDGWTEVHDDDNDDDDDNVQSNQPSPKGPNGKTDEKLPKERHKDDQAVEDNNKDNDGEEENNNNNNNNNPDETYQTVLEKIDSDGCVPSTTSVLEIGCGDAPLGIDLRNDLFKLEQLRRQRRIGTEDTREKTNVQNDTKKNNDIAKDLYPIVDRIVCFDYSEVVIQTMIERQTQQQQQQQDSNEESTSSDVPTSDTQSTLPLHYCVHDARRLPYADGEFGLVVDKGTIDATMSDAVNGAESCRQIVAEAGRVLCNNGYFLFVSHTNANNPQGLEWLETVVVSGLKRVMTGERTDWRIEVHGEEDTAECDGREDDEDEDENEEHTNAEKKNNDFDDGNDDGEKSQRRSTLVVYIIQKVIADENGDGEDGVKEANFVPKAYMKYLSY